MDLSALVSSRDQEEHNRYYQNMLDRDEELWRGLLTISMDSNTSFSFLTCLSPINPQNAVSAFKEKS